MFPTIRPASDRDLSTFERIALPELDFIFKSAYRMSGNRSDAEDLAQETFQTAFEKFSQLKDLAKIRSWLFMIMRNIYLKKVVRERKYPSVDLEVADYNPKEIKSVSQDVLSKIADSELQAVLDELEEKYKTPLVLSYLGGYSYQEIADMLHIPIGTVMSRISRGKAFLKRQILQASKKTR